MEPSYLYINIFIYIYGNNCFAVSTKGFVYISVESIVIYFQLRNNIFLATNIFVSEILTICNDNCKI